MAETKKKTSFWKLAQMWVALLSAIISIVVGVIANLSIVGVKEGKSIYYAIVVGFVGLLVVMTALVSYFKKGPTKVAVLKDALTNAFCSALDSSSLNPEATLRKTGTARLLLLTD